MVALTVVTAICGLDSGQQKRLFALPLGPSQPVDRRVEERLFGGRDGEN